MPRFDRRQALRLALSSAVSTVGLRALGVGVPIGFLTPAGRARAQAAPRTGVGFTILAISDTGDPINANAPGSYVDGVVNNPLPELAPVPTRLGPVETRAARVWAELPEDLRSRLAFFHGRTGVVTHPQLDEVLTLRGAITGEAGTRSEMLPSMMAREAAGDLQTILRDPIPLGREGLVAAGLPLDNVSPAELKSLFGSSTPGLTRLADLRDAALDELYADLRANGTRAQRSFLDAYAQSRGQARLLGEQLAALLERVSDNPVGPVEEARDQLLTAIALFQLRVTPVVTVHIPFGADNHQDDTLETEADAHVSGTELVETLWSELKAAGLEELTTFANLNVFGRTLYRNQVGGRDHNGDHHVMMAFGPRVRPGVYGGLARAERDFAATGIDAATGAAAPDGDIPAEETLVAAGRTLLTWAGFSDEVAARRLPAGRPIMGMVR